MKRSLAGGIATLAALGCYVSLRAQAPAPILPQAAPGPDPPDIILVPAGTPLGLELQDSLHTRFTRKGDRVSFKVSPEVLIADRLAIPRESSVDATVTVAKRGGLGRRKGELRFAFDRLVLTDGTSLALAARLTRVGRWNRSSKITQAGPSDRDIWEDLIGIAQLAGVGALLGDSIGAGKEAAIGAAAGAAIGITAILLERGPDLDLPPGIMFQVELTKPLQVPAAAGGGRQLVVGSIQPPLPSSQTADLLTKILSPAPDAANPPLDAGAPLKIDIPAPHTTPVAVDADTLPPPVAVSPPADASAAGSEPTFKFEVNVNLVLVEATVRDQRGAIYIKLKREDFLVLEDGVAQEILHFSRDELPLAVALVIDRSGSVAPFMDRLRRAAYETLSQLKAGDQVALFAFAAGTERLEDLTTDRQAIASSISTIQAEGGTNIKDALFDAAAYLGREAPGRRHAIILISDNQETVSSRADESQVTRTALETESVIYSIKVQARSLLDRLSHPVALQGSGSVKRITQETGGEIFDTKEMGSVESAMQAVISRLKLRFTLGYQSTNQRRDDAFRRLDVRLTKSEALPPGLTVFARRGYYAAKLATEPLPPPSPETSPAVAHASPPIDRPASAAEQGKVENKPFTNDDVLELVKAGFGEETILEAFRANECHFDTSADALTALKNAGVGERIIMAMLAAGRAPAK